MYIICAMTTQQADTDYGVPFPGAAVEPERHTQARVSLPRSGWFDWDAAFGKPAAPRVLDLGCGNGRFLLASALARPDHVHLGIELVPQAIQHAARRAGERGMDNVKFAWGDALEALFRRFAPQSLDELHVYHPQPYYDKDKVERRMLTPAFFVRAWTALRPGGLLVLQTDNPKYWRYIKSAAPRLFDWQAQAGPWPDAPAGRTRREIFARSRGLRIHKGTGTPLPLSPAQVEEIRRELPVPRFNANRRRFRDKPGRNRRERGERGERTERTEG